MSKSPEYHKKTKKEDLKRLSKKLDTGRKIRISSGELSANTECNSLILSVSGEYSTLRAANAIPAE